jgi:hypothetical protein
MTQEDGECDGWDCYHQFEDGEQYIFIENNPETKDLIFCTRECALTRMPIVFRYGAFGDEKEDEEE